MKHTNRLRFICSNVEYMGKTFLKTLKAHFIQQHPKLHCGY